MKCSHSRCSWTGELRAVEVYSSDFFFTFAENRISKHLLCRFILADSNRSFLAPSQRVNLNLFSIHRSAAIVFFKSTDNFS